MKHEKSCGCIIIEDKKVLLIKQTNGIWGFPKGHVEKNETELQTAEREVKEETNCDMQRILYYIDSFDYKSGSGKNARQYNFAIKVNGTDKIILTEHDAYSWETVEEIINNPKITDEVKKIIRRYIEIEHNMEKSEENR